MKTLIISASPRQASLSLRFSLYLKKELERYLSSGEVEVMDFEHFDIPSSGRAPLLIGQLSEFQTKLITSWGESDLIFFCLPEYNWTTNGEVFMMLDQFGTRTFAHLFDEKVFAMVGVSSGRGGRIPALEVGKVIEKLISFLGKMALVSPKIFEGHEIGLNLDGQANSTGNPVFESWVSDFVRYTLKLQRRWTIGASPQSTENVFIKTT